MWYKHESFERILGGRWSVSWRNNKIRARAEYFNLIELHNRGYTLHAENRIVQNKRSKPSVKKGKVKSNKRKKKKKKDQP